MTVNNSLTKYQKEQATEWKNASILDGILAMKSYNLIQSYNDLINCKRSNDAYVSNKLEQYRNVKN